MNEAHARGRGMTLRAKFNRWRCLRPLYRRQRQLDKSWDRYSKRRYALPAMDALHERRMDVIDEINAIQDEFSAATRNREEKGDG